MQFDWTYVVLIGLAAVAIFFMFRNSRRRRAQEEEQRSKIVPGAQIMTQHGIYGELISIDRDKNEAIIETTPGTQLKVHSQVIARVIEPEDESPADTEADAVAAAAPIDVVDEAPAGPQVAPPLEDDPKYGERLDEKKPRRPRKTTD